MGKRGRRRWKGYEDGPMPVTLAAKLLGMNPRSVNKYTKSALLKLKKYPGIISTLYVMEEELNSLPACGSVECLPPNLQER